MRIWTLDDDPEGQERFARMVHEGENRTTIADAFDIHVDTVTEWRKRPSISAQIKALNDDRENRIVSKIDARLAAKLDSGEKIDTKTLLEMRRTIDGTRVKQLPSGDAAAAMGELLRAAHADPELAAKLREIGVSAAG